MSAHEKKYADDKLFRFHWRTKAANGMAQVDQGYGRDVGDAFMRLGYSAGAMRALDYWREVQDANDAIAAE